uniref:neutral/alkaline non-lysosomal ceramidase N-terminal domain-containing protein n=1 Tax=uncultured Draconibacterium sp. TaxID=1573823 RepID=UPI003217F078
MIKLNIYLLIISGLLLSSIATKAGNVDNAKSWKAGVACIKITPEESMWLAGYIVRDHPSEGKLHDLWAKAIAFEDSDGNRSVLITTDLVGIQKKMSDNIRDRLNKKYNFSRSQIILNSSHTHQGPVVSQRQVYTYNLNVGEATKIAKYAKIVEEQIIKIVGKALKVMEPVDIYSGNGLTRFQVNRRTNDESTLTALTELKGPNDYAVPVLKVVNKKGKIKAIAFGYACHATVTNEYKWSGDYPGFAQIELEKMYPGAVALFFQGAAGNQNPLPRRSNALAQKYGVELANAVKCTLESEMRELNPSLSVAYSEIDLPMENPPSEQELVEMAKLYSDTAKTVTEKVIKNWTKRMLEILSNGKSLEDVYSGYPLQTWKLGDQLIIVMGGEPVIQYSIHFKELYGLETFVMGYSNDEMAYIPTSEILQQGGYEGKISQMACMLPAKWKPVIEEMIIKEVDKLVLIATSE